MQITTVPIDSLTSDPHNARKHTPKNLTAIKTSLKRFGQRLPLVVRDGVVVIGNGRLHVMKDLAWSSVDVVHADDLTEADARKLGLMDNRTGELAEWHDEILAEHLRAAGDDALDLGWSKNDLGKLLAQNDPRTVDDAPVEIAKTSTTKRGDVWRCGRHTVMCGSCFEIEGLQADHVITDPPYDARTHERPEYMQNMRPGFGPDFPALESIEITVKHLLQIATRWILSFCSLEMLGEYQQWGEHEYKRSGVWHRTDGCPQLTGDRPAQGAEGIAILHSSESAPRWNGGGHRAVWSYGIEKGDRHGHKTPKPLPLIADLVTQFTDEGDTVADPFLGSGTTLIACEQLGRTCLGIEIDPCHVDAAVQRWERLTGKKATKTNGSA